MRKLKLQMQLSLDGFVAGPNGEMDWMTWDWDDAIKNYVAEITEPVDCIILGRKLAQGFIQAWASRAADPATADHFSHKMNDTEKIVFSKSLEHMEGNNTHLVKGDMVAVISDLKNKPGKDIIVYGGANFVGNLIKAGLIDEYHFFINPTAIGKGMSIFSDIQGYVKLKLIKATSGTAGINILCYEPVRATAQ